MSAASIKRVLEHIAKFLRIFHSSAKGKDRPTSYAIEAFYNDLKEEEKLDKGFANDFCRFYESFNPALPGSGRGRNIYGTGADKEDMPKGNRSAIYRLLFWYDKKRNIIVFLSVYPKADEKLVFAGDAKKQLKELVDLLKAGNIPFSPLS